MRLRPPPKPRPTLPTQRDEQEPAQPALRHIRFDLSTLALNGISVSLVAATMVAARPEGAVAIDWEIIASTTDLLEVEQGVYDIEARTTDHRVLRGSALLVRSDGRSHVLRGAAELEGLTDSDLS